MKLPLFLSSDLFAKKSKSAATISKKAAAIANPHDQLRSSEIVTNDSEKKPAFKSGSQAAYYYYRPQRSYGKVMFLHLPVILFTGGCLPTGRHPPGRTPPLGRHPSADTPWADTPPGQTPPHWAAQSLSRHPRQPPRADIPWADIPLGRHSPGRHPLWQTTPTPGQTLSPLFRAAE